MATPSRGVRGALTGETAAEWVKARADCMVHERADGCWRSGRGPGDLCTLGGRGAVFARASGLGREEGRRQWGGRSQLMGHFSRGCLGANMNAWRSCVAGREERLRASRARRLEP